MQHEYDIFVGKQHEHLARLKELFDGNEDIYKCGFCKYTVKKYLNAKSIEVENYNPKTAQTIINWAFEYINNNTY